MSNSIVLKARNISKKIGKKVVINDVSINLWQGDILGFIGPNGAGKTTLIKLLLGLQFYNNGTVNINGYDLKKEFPKAICNIGAIIETPELYTYMSGYENLKVVADLYKMPKEKILEVIKIVGLENSIHEKVKKYSLGMRQRLGIAQSLIHDPKILILDEPMNGLDPEGIKDLKNLISKLAKEKKMAILISSHILSELENFCNRFCILLRGRIIKDLKQDELKEITQIENYLLEVSDTKLDNLLYNFEIIDNFHIRINTSKNNLTNILKTLLLNKIDVYEIKKEIVTLEEIFINVTKDK